MGALILWRKHISPMYSSGSGLMLLPLLVMGAVLFILYTTFVVPLLDYRDVVWYSTAAKLTAVIKRVHCKFYKRLPPSNRLSYFNCGTTQPFRFISCSQILTILSARHFQVMLIAMLIVHSFPEFPIMRREALLSWGCSVEQPEFCCCRGCMFKKFYLFIYLLLLYGVYAKGLQVTGACSPKKTNNKIHY